MASLLVNQPLCYLIARDAAAHAMPPHTHHPLRPGGCEVVVARVPPGMGRSRQLVLQQEGDDDERYLAAIEARLRRVAADGTRAADASEVPTLLRRSALTARFNRYAESPRRMLLLGTLFLFLGFYFAHFLDTVFGQSGYWETVAGFVTLVVSERVTREYYSTPAEQRPPLLKLTNAFKAGLYYGLVLDAIKMSS